MAEAAGGPPVVVSRLVEGARAAGWQAEILTSSDYCEDKGARLSQLASMTVLRSQLSALYGSGRSRIFEAVQGADILHCHTMWSPLVTAAAAIARRLGKPYVLSPHGMLDPYSIAQKSLRKRLYICAFERHTLTGAATVLFTAGLERELAQKNFGKIPRSAVVSLGADPLPENGEHLRAKFFKQYPDLVGRPILLFLGRLHPKKRPELLLDVITIVRHTHPRAVLLYAGTGETRHLDSIQAKARSMAIGDCVYFLGHLKGVEKAAALFAADIFVLPSQQENFAIAVAEALHAGTPVIVSKNVNIWPEIENAGAGFAFGEDNLTTEIASKVESILLDSGLRHELSIGAANLASTSFNWNQAASGTLEIYDNILREI